MNPKGISGFQDTIVAPATIPGTGALTVIRVSGPESLPVTQKIVRFKNGNIKDFPGFTIHYGEVYEDDGILLDEVLVSVFRGPNSYTGEDCAELSCHASQYIADRLVEMFLDNGARLAEPGEFTRRAFINGKMDLSQAEAVADVISSNAAASHRLAVNQLRGGISNEMLSIRESLVHLGALLELELDFSEEDVEFSDRKALVEIVGAVRGHMEKVSSTFRSGNALRSGIPVAIAGDVNSGKSTLLNALLQEDRAIVSDIPGTTRDTVEEVLSIGPYLFRFIDTAGIRETSEQIEKAGIERSFRKITDADFIVAVLDLSAGVKAMEVSLSQIMERTDFSVQKLIILFNKADLIGENELNNNVNIINNLVLSKGYQANSITASAKLNSGIDDLKKTLLREENEIVTLQGSTIITSRRHYEALENAVRSLDRLESGINDGSPADLLAEDLRDALYHLGSITGEITDQEILGQIFEKFCIGK